MVNKIILSSVLILICTSDAISQLVHERFDSLPLNDKWDWELEDRSRLKIDTLNKKEGNGSLSISLQQGDKSAGGHRSELKLFTNRANMPELEVWYSYSFYFPESFKDTTLNNNQHIITQWHDRPPNGYTWSNYKGHEPSINLVYLFENNQSKIALNYGNNYHSYDTLPDGTKPLKLKNQARVAEANIEKGEWVDIIYHIKWSLDDHGFIEVWLNGRPWTNFNGTDYKIYGANMYNSSPQYFKFGLYRSKNITATNSINIDEFRVARTSTDGINPLYLYVDTIQVIDTTFIEYVDTVRITAYDTVIYNVYDSTLINIYDTIITEYNVYDTFSVCLDTQVLYDLVYDSCSTILSSTPDINRTDISIFPTINSGNFNLRYSGVHELLNVKILSLSGTLIEEFNDLSEKDINIDLPDNIQPGIYFVLSEVIDAGANLKVHFLDKIIIRD
ncbi:MAG: polysaccharide lyase [Cyclobacteriaceae bacterium]